MSSKLRTTLYICILVAAISNIGLGVACAMFNGFAPYTRYFGSVSAVTGLFSTIWIIVLISYHKRPLSEHLLTRASVHFLSFIAFVPFWIAISIMMASQAPYECDFETYSDGEAGGWCGSVVSASILAFTTSALASVGAFLIYRVARRSGYGLTTINIANLDKQGSFEVRAGY